MREDERTHVNTDGVVSNSKVTMLYQVRTDNFQINTSKRGGNMEGIWE